MAKKAVRAADATKYWLVKTEPESFSVDDFLRQPDRTTYWDGVRNYQARNFLRDEFKQGHEVLIYHSSADPPAIVGLALVVRESYPDHTAWDAAGAHYDPASTPENPRWFMIDLQLVEKFASPLTLAELRALPELAGMELLRKGSRLSVQPVRPEEFRVIMALVKKVSKPPKKKQDG